MKTSVGISTHKTSDCFSHSFEHDTIIKLSTSYSEKKNVTFRDKSSEENFRNFENKYQHFQVNCEDVELRRQHFHINVRNK